MVRFKCTTGVRLCTARAVHVRHPFTVSAHVGRQLKKLRHLASARLTCMFLVSILQTAHLWANTGVVFRELSFFRLECGVHDRLHIYPLCGIFDFPWHRHQIEGTNGFYCLIRKTERFTISNVESQVVTPRIILA